MTEDKIHLRDIRTFGRRDGRPLSRRQQTLVDDLLPRISIERESDAPITSSSLFDEATKDIWLEIGFGGGEHLIRRARQYPDIGLIGAEPFIDGVAKALGGIDDHKLENVRLFPDDVRLILPRMEAGLIKHCFILFPDPWPKRRQQKRRLIQPDFLDDLARVMAPGAPLRFATDVASYADEALWRILQHGAFEWQAEKADDWRKQPEDHEATRYQLKGLGDCAPVWLEFQRI